jgi:hypothetical protein
MIHLKKILLGAAAAISLTVACGNLSAQPGGTNGGAFNPQQFQQNMQGRMTQFFREQLDVTNDDEWKIISTRLTKVTTLKTASTMSGMGGMTAMFRGMRNTNGAARDGQAAPRGFPGFGQTDPDADALQKAIDDKAPTEQIKSAMARVRESRKRRQAELAKAQEELRQVLSTRQEAVMVSMGMLD